MNTPSNFQDDSQITPQQNAIKIHKENGGTRESAIAEWNSLGFAENGQHRQVLADIDAVYGTETISSNSDLSNRILPNQVVPDIYPNHPDGKLAQSREQKLEQATNNKQKTIDNVSALKQAGIEQTSNKVAASLDPQLQKQYDLDNLELSDYRIKYGIGSDIIVEYVKNSMAKNSIKRAKREKQALADSQDTVDVIRDTSLGLLATGATIIGGTPATAMAVAADPVESAIALADGSVKLGAAFTGTLEEYEKNKEEAKANVNQFLEERGIGPDVAKPLPEKLESENAPTLTEDFMEVLSNLGQNKYGKDLLRGGSDMLFRGTKAVSDWIRSGQSDAYKAASELRAEENEEFKTKIKDTLGEDSTVYENMAANTQIGFNAFGNLMKDPSAATVVAIESVPYMLAAGNISKSISSTKFDLAFNREKAKITEAVNKENLSHFNTQELIKVKLGDIAGDLIKKKDADQDTITAISAGILEGSGAANEAYNVIISTDFDVLKGTSKEYNKNLKTMTPYEARKALATDSALSAGLSVFAIAAGTVKILGNAEVINKAVGITKSKSKGVMPKSVELMSDIGKEGIEETFQSFIGGAATGIVEKENVNPDKDIFGDAAIQAGEGGLAGALSSGAISTVRLTGEALSKVKSIAKASNQKVADVEAKVQDIAKSGLSEADKAVTGTDTEIDVVAEGISERNQVETTKPDEQVDNLAEGWDIIEKYEAELEKVKDSFRAKANKQDSETIKAGQEKLNRAYEAFEKATIRNANSEELHKDILALKEGDKGAESRVLNNMATNPESVPEEAARALLNTGSLNEQQTAQVEAHLQYIEDSKSIGEVAKDVKDGSEGYIGADQYLSRISAALKANRPEQATKSLQMLSAFAERQATKSRDYTEALALTQTSNPTPVQRARLLELQNKYARNVKTKIGYKKVPAYFDQPGSVRLVEQIGLEANMLQSAVATASLNIKASTEGSNKAPESTSNETDTTSPEPETSTVEEPTETPTQLQEEQNDSTTPTSNDTVSSDTNVQEQVSTENVQSKMTAEIANRINPSAKHHLPKEQVKTKIATQFIGQGSKNSSTDNYKVMYSAENLANTGNYTSEDIIYVSSNGKRSGRFNPVKNDKLQGAYTNIDKAIAAGATFVMDTAAHLQKTKSYNLGEMQLGKYLSNNGYFRQGTSGIWKPTQAESQSTETTSVVEESVQDEARKAKDLLKELIQSEAFNYKGKARGVIARAILNKLSDDVTVTLVSADSPKLVHPRTGEIHPAMHYPETAEVFISKDLDKIKYNENLLHELIHSVLVPAYKVSSNKTPKEKQFINEINTLYKFMVKKAKEDGVDTVPEIAYGLSNVDEFLAMGMSNPTFMKWMSDTEIAGKTILSRFAKAVADLLGINKKYYSALENMLDISDLVLDDAPIQENQTKEPEVTTDTVQEETIEPVEVEGSNNIEQLVGTTDTTKDAVQTYESYANTEARLKAFKKENLVKKYFRPKNKNGVTKNPLLNVSNFMGKFSSNIKGYIATYTGSGKVSTKQELLAQQLIEHHKSFKESLEGVFKYNPSTYGTRDMSQFVTDSEGNIQGSVIEAMSVATYNWIATRSGETLFNSDSDIKDILGLNIQDIVTPNMQEYLRDGGFRRNISEEIGSNIVKSLGIDAVKTAPSNMKSQLENSLGSLAVAALNAQGLIVETKVPSWKLFSDVTNKKVTIAKVTVANVPGEQFKELHPLIKEYVDSVKDTDQLLTKMFQVENYSKGPIKEPNKNVSKIVRGTKQKVSQYYQDVIRKHQTLKHYLKRDQVEQFVALPIEVQREMLGYTFDMDTIHEKRKEAVEGVNRAINASINHMTDYLVENNNDEPFYFNHDVMKNGRLLMDSTTFNPQGNKLHRHMIKIEGQESIIDLRSKDPTQLNSFLIAIGQAMGIDIDKQNQTKSIAEVRTMIDKPWFVNAIQAINSKDGEYTQEQLDYILAAVKEGGEKAWSFDALVAYAAYTKASLDSSELFTHDLMVEADGITNGPAIGTIQFGIGNSYEDKKNRLKKVGMNTDGDTEEFGDYISQPMNRDNYETITMELNNKIQALTGDSLELAQFTTFLLGELIKVDPHGNEKINRNISKNPLMTTIYGAGKKSIKDSVGKAVIDEIYKYIETNANDPQKLAELGKILNKTFNLKITPKDLRKPLEFTLDAQLEQRIANSVGTVFGIAMLEAIDEQYGQFKEGTQIVNDSMGMVAEIFNDMYQYAVEEKTKEMVEDGTLAANAKGEPFEALPQIEIDNILSNLIESQPIMQSVLSAKNNDKTEEGLYVGKIKKQINNTTAYQVRQDYKNKTSVNFQGKTDAYISGGASPVVLAVQNIDATTMLEHLKDKASFNVYDAIIVGTDYVEDHTKNINTKFYEINRDHSIVMEARKAFQRAESAARRFDKENNTNFATRFNETIEKGFGDDIQEVNVKQELDTSAKATEQARLDTVSMITSTGQYGWENSSYATPNAETRPLGSNPNFDAVDGQYESKSEEEVNKLNVLQVFDEVGKLGNKQESKSHSEFLRKGLNSLKHQLINPIKLHINEVLGDTMANIEGKDIWLYTQMFGGQKGSTAIANSGLRMSTQEALAHELWHAVSRQGVEGNTKAKKELERRWKQAKQTIKVTDLMDDSTLPETSDEYIQAKETWDYIFTERDDLVEIEVDPVSGQKIEKNYSNHLHEFAAYSMTNQKFIAALKIVPADTKVKSETEVTTDSEGNAVTNYLSNLYDKLVEFLGDIVDMLSTHLTNTNNVPTDFAVRELVKQLSNIEAQNKNLILSTIDSVEGAQGKLGTLVSPVVSGITKGLKAVATAPFIRNSKSAIIKLPSNIVKLSDNSEHAKYVFNKINQTKRNLASQKEGFAEQLWTEAQGLQEKFKGFHSLSRLKTKIIDGAVVETEAQTLRILEKAFGKPLTEEQSHAITKAFLKTDLSTMNLNTTQLIELLDDPARIDSLISTLESKFKGDVNENHYLLQTKALGYYMATGKVTSANLNFNAKQIARLFGTNRTNVNAAKVERSIDQLATLYALKYTNTKSKQGLSDVLKSNPEGMEYLQAFHNEQKKIDTEEIFTGSEVNITKGHIREILDPTVQMKVLNEIEGDVYEARGWVKSANPLPKDPADPNAIPLFTYVDRHGGQTETITGVVSLTSKQARGTDTIALRSKFGSTDPVYGGVQDAKVIHAQKSVIFRNSISGAKTFDPTIAKQHMAPLYNLNGDITGYRYLMNDVTKEKTLGRNNDALRVLAKGAASTVNKVNSAELNSKAIKALKDQFDAEPNSNYVQVGPKSNDPEVLEIYRLLPKEAKADIKKYWGGNTMFVDKKVLTMMFGYRKYSVADQIAKERAEQNFAIRGLEYVNGVVGGAFGYSSEQVARSSGQYWGEFVRFAKDFIVIKSGIVTLGNTISNGIHLLTEGIGLINSLKLQKEAIVELTKYRKDKAALFEAEKALELGIGDQKGLPAKIAGLKASITSNPVTDVINDGLLQTIVEDVSLVDDEFSKAAKIDNALDKVVYRHIPGWTKAIGRELFQTKDSILYKKMSQSAQLSDFTARYALYKHTLNHTNPSKRLNRQDAANNAISTFINYDLPTHKLIQYGNDMGFLWFTKYYVRVQKILLKTLINNTARVLGLLSFEWMFGDVFPDIYDTTLAPENIYNRVGLPKNPVDVFLEDSLVSKVL